MQTSYVFQDYVFVFPSSFILLLPTNLFLVQFIIQIHSVESSSEFGRYKTSNQLHEKLSCNIWIPAAINHIHQSEPQTIGAYNNIESLDNAAS